MGRNCLEALEEIKNRLVYFCARTDGTYSPPWVKELVEIADEGLERAKEDAAFDRDLEEALDEVDRQYEDECKAEVEQELEDEFRAMEDDYYDPESPRYWDGIPEHY